MLTLPEVILAAEDARIDRRNSFPIRPASPIHAEIPRVAKHVGTESSVCESVLATRVAKRIVIVVSFWEDHDIVGSSFAQQKVIGRLIEC